VSDVLFGLVNDALFLAVEESIPPDHLASRLAVPLGFLFFSGSIYLLLWSNYGARKGAAIYGTGFFGFALILGVFWWFGAPGTPQNLGVTFLPGQETNHYQPRWYAMEPGSERAEFFGVTETPDEFQTVPEYLGVTGLSEEELEEDPRTSELLADLDGAVDQMEGQFLPIDENDVAQIGAERRAGLEEEATEARPEEAAMRAAPFYTAELLEDPRLTEDPETGTRVVMGEFQVFANFMDADEVPVDPIPVGEPGMWFAFYDPGGEWIPSALWTGISAGGFLLSLFWLDRLEMRDKRRLTDEVEEPEDLAVPIAQ
jgi:hypothetical protein